jgi:hypothetical protein
VGKESREEEDSGQNRKIDGQTLQDKDLLVRLMGIAKTARSSVSARGIPSPEAYRHKQLTRRLDNSKWV